MKLDKRLLAEARRARLQLAVSIALGFLSGALLVAQAYLLSRAISLVFLDGQALGHPAQSKGLADVAPLLLELVGVALLRAATSWGSEVSASAVAIRLKTDLRRRLFDRIVALGPAYAAGEHSGELTNTLTEGVEALEAYFREYLPQIALALLVPLAFLIIVLPLDPLTGLVLLLTAPLIPFFMFLIGSYADTLTRRQWSLLSRLSAHFLDVLQGLTTLKIFGRSREQVRIIARISQQYGDVTMSVLRVAFLSALVMEFLATISVAIVAVEIGLRLLRGGIDFQAALFILILAPEFYIPLRLLGQRFHAGMAGVAAAGRIFEVLEVSTSTNQPSGESATQNSEFRIQSSEFRIVFSDVHFAYPASSTERFGESGRRVALNGLSYELRAGEILALVGPSGAGKTTVTSLLLRFIEPQAGQITLDGRPLNQIPTIQWRQQVAWLPQRPYLFNVSVAENIRLGRPGASPDDVIAATRLAHADDFIAALPGGYDTIVGERGARLSGGQAQRIALARSFLKDAPLLILDEPAASLDPELEAQLRDSLARLMQGRSVLLIAHRLNSVARADRIVVLERGRVVQTGRHEELLAQEGLYRRLVGANSG